MVLSEVFLQQQLFQLSKFYTFFTVFISTCVVFASGGGGGAGVFIATQGIAY